MVERKFRAEEAAQRRRKEGSSDCRELHGGRKKGRKEKSG